ncbi:MAG: Rad52/Rad22 family DNA repair protein [Acidobacteriota bacterium]
MKQLKKEEAVEMASDVNEMDTTTNNVLDFSSTLRELKRSVDPNLVRQRAAHRGSDGSVHMVDYVEWHTVADILDEHAANWSHTVKDIRPIGEIITITVAITIDGITREGIGTGRANSETGIKKAEHDALKRAAVKFGIARELYKREFDTVEQVIAVPAASETGPQIVDPVAKTLGDMVTARQLGMIRAVARETSVEADAECTAFLGCRVDELSKRAASEFIEHLQGIQRNICSGVALPMRRAS